MPNLGQNKTSKPKKPDTVSIEQKIASLDQSIEWFYGDEFSLDQAISHYKSAVELSKSIQSDLEHLKNEVEVIADFSKS